MGHRTSHFLCFYHVMLTLETTKRYMGRASHLQVLEVPSDLASESVSHRVLFWDGENRRELLGKATWSSQNEVLTLDMGCGKIYNFIKLGRP